VLFAISFNFACFPFASTMSITLMLMQCICQVLCFTLVDS